MRDFESFLLKLNDDTSKNEVYISVENSPNLNSIYLILSDTVTAYEP